MGTYPTSAERLLNIAEAAEFLRVSKKTIWNYSSPRGKLQCCKIGSRTVYRLADLEAFIELCRVPVLDGGAS